MGTPIGNLGDMSYRAIETLKAVDFIAAEDTRVTKKLLNYFEISKPMVSYHEHNHKYSGESIIRRILEGESCAVVTDAGMPCISDPGEDLVKLCAEHGVPIEVVPGPSAVISALAISGLTTAKFAFEGFLSTANKSRVETLERCKTEERTLIFYEAPHKLIATLADMLKYFGNRKISLCRELTKIHEEAIRTTLAEAVNLYSEENKPRGEYVLIIEGYTPEAEISEPEDALLAVKELVANGKKPTDACKEVAKKTGLSKSELYSMLLAEKGGEND